MDAQAGDKIGVLRRYLTNTDLYDGLVALVEDAIAYERRGHVDKSDVLREIRDTLRQKDRIEAMEKIKQKIATEREAGQKELTK